MNPDAPIPSEIQALRERLGERYFIERELGRGGMGAVYLGRDLRLDRLVALKVLPPQFAVQPVLRDRFLRETRTAAGFSHPNIVPVYAVEESDDFLAYAMGFVEGESLLERVRRAGPMNVREAVKLMQDVAYALAYAHGRGIVHRDIKPDNIMMDRASGRALVMDFGIARAKANKPVAQSSAAEGLTRVGEVVGTPEYMSPEQASGDEVDGRSDLYALGLTVMFALTGEQAVSADTTQKVLVKQLTERLPSIVTMRPDLPVALSSAVDRCVLKDPEERFATAEGLVDALDVAQLAAPEIPLAIRMFGNEVGTLTTIFAIAAFGLLYLVRNAGAEDPAEQILIVVLVLAVLVARVLQTLKEASRLAVAGFTPDEVLNGLRQVADERGVRVAELRADAAVVRARRRTMLVAAAMLVVAVALFMLALNMREQYAPGRFQSGAGAFAMLVSSTSMFGVSLVLLLKSPLRLPLGERVFRRVWLGPVGRAFVRFGGRNAARTRAAAKSPVQAATPQTVEARLSALERRLGALERRGPN